MLLTIVSFDIHNIGEKQIGADIHNALRSETVQERLNILVPADKQLKTRG